MTPFSLLSREERRETVKERNALLKRDGEAVTPPGFATLRPRRDG